jgi:hypothetical protein
MDQSNILYVGLDVRKDSIDIATADPGRDGEVRRLGSIGGDLTALDQALRKMISRPPGTRSSRRSAVGAAEPDGRAASAPSPVAAR